MRYCQYLSDIFTSSSPIRKNAYENSIYSIANKHLQNVQPDTEIVHLYEDLADAYVQTALAQRKAYHADLNGSLKNYESYEVFQKPWALIAEMDGIQLFQKQHDFRQSATCLQAMGYIDGNYNELSQIFNAKSRSDCLEVEKMLHSSAVDADILYHQQPRSTRGLMDPMSTTIKWVLHKPSESEFHFDTCYFEISGVSYTPEGETFGFRVTLPMRLPQCPEFSEDLHIKRVSTRSVMLFFPTKHPRTSEMFYVMQTDFRRKILTDLGLSYYSKFIEGLALLNQCHKSRIQLKSRSSHKRLTSLLQNRNKLHLNGSNGNRRAHKARCIFCLRSFSLFRPMHECGYCNKPVCSKCIVSSLVAVDAPLDSKMCLRCFRGSPRYTRYPWIGKHNKYI